MQWAMNGIYFAAEIIFGNRLRRKFYRNITRTFPRHLWFKFVDLEVLDGELSRLNSIIFVSSSNDGGTFHRMNFLGTCHVTTCST